MSGIRPTRFKKIKADELDIPLGAMKNVVDHFRFYLAGDADDGTIARFYIHENNGGVIQLLDARLLTPGSGGVTFVSIEKNGVDIWVTDDMVESTPSIGDGANDLNSTIYPSLETRTLNYGDIISIVTWTDPVEATRGQELVGVLEIIYNATAAT